MSKAEIWRSDCGRAVLYRGDCLEVLPELSGIDAVVTDPPYGLGKKITRGGGWSTRGATLTGTGLKDGTFQLALKGFQK